MDEVRVQASLGITVAVLSLVYLIFWPFAVMIGIPFIVLGSLVAAAGLWLFKRYDLSNYWYSQLLAAVMSWPLVYNSVSFSDSLHITTLRHTHLAFMVLFFVHVGGAVVWFTGVFRNSIQFPGVAKTFPFHSLLSLPLLLAITWGLVSTSLKVAEWARSLS